MTKKTKDATLLVLGLDNAGKFDTFYDLDFGRS